MSDILTDHDKEEVLKCIFDGHSLLKACAFNAIDPYEFAQARKMDKTFDTDIRAAQAFRVDCMADNLLEAHKKWTDPKMAAVMSKNIQWLASKRLREIYGDKVDHNVNVQVDIRQAMVMASERVLMLHGDNQLIEHNTMTDNISDIHSPIDALPLPNEDDDDDVDPLS